MNAHVHHHHGRHDPSLDVEAPDPDCEPGEDPLDCEDAEDIEDDSQITELN
jgi:hypothetical protein